MTTGKTIALTTQTFVGKAMSLLFDTVNFPPVGGSTCTNTFEWILAAFSSKVIMASHPSLLETESNFRVNILTQTTALIKGKKAHI